MNDRTDLLTLIAGLTLLVAITAVITYLNISTWLECRAQGNGLWYCWKLVSK